MLNEYDVRQEISQIERSEANPIRKARNLVAIARQLSKNAGRLGDGVSILSNDGMDDEAGRLQRTARRLNCLNSEVMDRARLILAQAKLAKAGNENKHPFSALN